MPTIDFPGDVVDTTPTFLVGGNANTGQPSKAAIGVTGLALAATATATAARTVLGLGTAALQPTTAFDAAGTGAAAAAAAQAASCQKSANLSDVADAATARNNILPSQSANAGKALFTDGSNASWQAIGGGGDMIAANNLSDVANAATALTNILPAQGGQSGKALITNGTTASWQAAGGGDMLAANNLSELSAPSTAVANLALGVVRSVSANTTLLASDNGKTIVTTGTVTITMPGTSMPNGFHVFIIVSSGTVSFSGPVTDNRIAGLAAPNGIFLYNTGTNTYRAFSTGKGDLVAANNLSDVPTPSTALSNLGGAPAIVTRSADFTAVNGGSYTVTANCIVTDPSPVQGLGYMVVVRSGVVTVGGLNYSGGVLLYRLYNSGSWSTLVYTQSVMAGPTPLVDGATITIDASTGTDFSVTLGGDRQLAFTNLSAGKRGVILVTQDGTGGRVLAPPVGAKTPGGAGILLTVTANALDLVNYWYDGITLYIAAGYRNMA